MESLSKKYADTSEWAGDEQAGVKSATEDTLRRLVKANANYLEKFGYIFIVCASGKSATQMLEILESRLHNDADTELTIASEEQLKITILRLRKLEQ